MSIGSRWRPIRSMSTHPSGPNPVANVSRSAYCSTAHSSTSSGDRPSSLRGPVGQTGVAGDKFGSYG